MGPDGDAVRRPWRTLAVVLTVAAAMVLAACGGSSSGSKTETTATTTAGASTSEVDIAAAKEFIAPYVGQPSAFPATEPLKKKPAAGSKIAFLDNGTPSTPIFWGYIEAAAKAIGASPYRVRTGNDAKSIGAAMDTVVTQKPAGVIFLGMEPRLMSNQLKALQKAGTTVVAAAITNGPEMNLEGVQAGPKFMNLMGELMVAWAVVRSDGKVRNIAYYNIPELQFSQSTRDGVESGIKKFCPACKMRSVDISVANIANASPGIISDLQAHSDTDYLMFPTEDLTMGLPSAMKTAGIDIKTIAPSPSLPEYEYIKNGQQDAAIGSDTPVFMWGLVDVWARMHTGQALQGQQADGMGLVNQFLTKDDITFDPRVGWQGYPDYVERFKKLWGAG